MMGSFQPHENIDSDFLLAMKLHKEINGPDADAALLIQNQNDSILQSQAGNPSNTAQLQQNPNPAAKPVPEVNARMVSRMQAVSSSVTTQAQATSSISSAQPQAIATQKQAAPLPTYNYPKVPTLNFQPIPPLVLDNINLPAVPFTRNRFSASRITQPPWLHAVSSSVQTSCTKLYTMVQTQTQATSSISSAQPQAVSTQKGAAPLPTYNYLEVPTHITAPNPLVPNNTNLTAVQFFHNPWWLASQIIRPSSLQAVSSSVPTQTQATSSIGSAQPQAASTPKQAAPVPVSKPTTATINQQPAAETTHRSYPWMIQRSLKPWLVPTSVRPSSSAASSENKPSTSAEAELIRIANSSKLIKKEKPAGNQLLLAAQQHLHHQDRPSTSTANVPPKQKKSTQIIVVETKRTSPEDYHMPALNSFIKDSLEDWKIIDIEPKVQEIWSALRNAYFRCAPRLTIYIPVWNGPEFTDLTNFRIDTERRRVVLNPTALLKRSRLYLINVLFHVLIHCSVYESSVARGRRIDDHDANFNQIKNHFNENLDLEIGTDHSFLRADSDDLDSYQCQASCSRNSANMFRGIIKCRPGSPVPPPLIVESTHSKCDGKFHKVFEISRTLNNNIETHYVVHKTHENPTSAERCAENNQKINMKPREFIDITDDDNAMDAAGPKVTAATQIIDLEDDEFSDKKKQNTRKIVEQFKSQPRKLFDICPFCNTSVIEFGGLRPHLDLCLG